MEKIDYTKECLLIINKCKLTLDDILYIVNQTKAKTSKDLYFELDEMLTNNQIRIGE